LQEVRDVGHPSVRGRDRVCGLRFCIELTVLMNFDIEG
jgi:hypothetical protein